MIIDGRALASSILASAKEQVAPLGRTPVVRAVVVSPNKATESYLRIKARRAVEAGMELSLSHLPDDASMEMVLEAINAPGADAVIVQLPLPHPLSTKEAVNAIPLLKDADVLSEEAYQAFVEDREGALLPPVVGAVEAILKETKTDPRGKNVVIVGQGRLVGEPARAYLSRFSSVAVLSRESNDLSLLKEADIVVSGAGHAGLITPDLLKEGVVLIDAGTSESNGALMGDAEPSCAEVASVFTPVPGGVGPVAVACLFQNVATLLARK